MISPGPEAVIAAWIVVKFPPPVESTTWTGFWKLAWAREEMRLAANGIASNLALNICILILICLRLGESIPILWQPPCFVTPTVIESLLLLRERETESVDLPVQNYLGDKSTHTGPLGDGIRNTKGCW